MDFALWESFHAAQSHPVASAGFDGAAGTLWDSRWEKALENSARTVGLFSGIHMICVGQQVRFLKQFSKAM